MSEFDLVIRGGTIVTGSDQFAADVGVKGGQVVALGRLQGSADRVVDADGMLVMPGGVDNHVHVDQPAPGVEMCDDFDSGTASAAAGGTTTIICFSWQEKGQSLAAVTAGYHEKAKKARVDYTFHLTITDPTPTVLKEELPRLIADGSRSIKIFMTYDGVRLNDAEVIRVLAEARRNRALVCVHAEHHDLLMWITEQLVEAGLTAPKYHAWGKPMVVEREAVNRIIAFAEALDVPIQVFHVSGAESAEEIARAQARGLKVWAETCPHYLTLTADDLDRPGFEGAKFVFGPPARTRADQEALWGYIRRGVIDVVSSDHSPTRFDDRKGKKVAGDNAPFNRIPNGIPGLAARLPVLFTEGVSRGRIDAPAFVRLVSTNPAKLFGLFPRKGTIAIGSDADVVIFDPNKSVTLTNAHMHHGGDYTPYEGYRTQGYPAATYVRGALVFDGEKVVGAPGYGQFLARPPYSLIEPRGRFSSPFNPVERALIE
jgi:dihydropyrimidinase